MLKKCVVCEGVFEARRPSADICCGKECTRINHRRRNKALKNAQYVPVADKICIVCGKNFKPIGSAKTCSGVCRYERDKEMDRNSKRRCMTREKRRVHHFRYLSKPEKLQAKRDRDLIRSACETAAYNQFKSILGEEILNIGSSKDERRRASYKLARELQSKGIEALL